MHKLNAAIILALAFMLPLSARGEPVDADTGLRDYDPCVVDATADRIVVDVWGEVFTSADFDPDCDSDEVTVVVGLDASGALALDQIEWVEHGDATVVILEIDGQTTAEPYCDAQHQSCPPPSSGCDIDQSCGPPWSGVKKKKIHTKAKCLNGHKDGCGPTL